MVELNKTGMVCFIAKDAADIDTCLKIRNDVFVKELKMFSYTDYDKFDKRATLIGIKKNNEIIGTVRVYEKEKGILYGGRLAVVKGERRGSAARLLVRAAEDIAFERKAEKFFALVQKKNINFFRKMGWEVKKGSFTYQGTLHYLMESGFKKKEGLL